MTPQELVAKLERLRSVLEESGPERAAYAMGREFHKYVADDVLVRHSHSRGTRTTSAPGEPPALVTGALKRSVALEPAIRTGPYTARSAVMPRIIYARIQELGGTIRVLLRWETVTDRLGRKIRVRKGWLHWVQGGKSYFAQSVTLPARPYMRPSHDEMVRSGRLRDAASREVERLVRSVL